VRKVESTNTQREEKDLVIIITRLFTTQRQLAKKLRSKKDLKVRKKPESGYEIKTTEDRREKTQHDDVGIVKKKKRARRAQLERVRSQETGMMTTPRKSKTSRW